MNDLVFMASCKEFQIFSFASEKQQVYYCFSRLFSLTFATEQHQSQIFVQRNTSNLQIMVLKSIFCLYGSNLLSKHFAKHFTFCISHIFAFRNLRMFAFSQFTHVRIFAIYACSHFRNLRIFAFALFQDYHPFQRNILARSF